MRAFAHNHGFGRLRLGSIVVLTLAACCGCGGTPVPPPNVVPVVTTPPPGSASTAPTTQQPRQACALVPLELFVRAPDGQTRPILSLDSSGQVYVSMMGASKLLAHFDPRGCLVSDDGVEVDVTHGGTVWTPHERFQFSGSTLRLEAGRALRIHPNGAVVTLAADGSVEPDTYGGFAFRGYGERAACAARVLLITFFQMMPSMAVSDGHPAMLSPPEDSSCAEFHRQQRTNH